MLRAEILCDSPEHPVLSALHNLCERRKENFILRNHLETVTNGDILFLVSCHAIVKKDVRDRFKHTLVLHASDLPNGRGWSPYVYEVLAGKKLITLSLLEAEDKVDTGAIWLKKQIPLSGNELFHEINNALFSAEIELIERAVDEYDQITPQPQIGEASYYPRRAPKDSEIDVNKTLAEQFELLRICDPERFPAFFEYRGRKFKLILAEA